MSDLSRSFSIGMKTLAELDVFINTYSINIVTKLKEQYCKPKFQVKEIEKSVATKEALINKIAVRSGKKTGADINVIWTNSKSENIRVNVQPSCKIEDYIIYILAIFGVIVFFAGILVGTVYITPLLPPGYKRFSARIGVLLGMAAGVLGALVVGFVLVMIIFPFYNHVVLTKIDKENNETFAKQILADVEKIYIDTFF